MTSALKRLERQVNVRRPPDRQRADGLAQLTLDGRELDRKVAQAVQTADVDESIEGAATLTLGLIDDDDALLRSGIFDAAVRAQLWDREFRLVAIDSTQAALKLTLEDEDVAVLRGRKSPRKASRAKVTRLEFIVMLVRSVRSRRIEVFAPELHKKRPIAKDTAPAPRRNVDDEDADRRTGGFPDDPGDLTIAGSPVSRPQLRQVGRSLRVADEVNATKRAVIAMLCAGIGESGFKAIMNLGGSPYGGVFQGDVRGGVFDMKDTEGMARSFLLGGKGFQGGGAIALAKAHPTWGPGLIAVTVEGSRSNFSSDAEAERHYGQWKSEAQALFEAWGGPAAFEGGGSTYHAQYQFRVGGPDNKHEGYWDAIGRLVDEVEFRRFMRRGVLWLVSETWMTKQRPRYVLSRATEGVQQIAFRYDVAKETQTATVVAFADQFEFLPGDAVRLERLGAQANGAYVISSARRSLFSPLVSVELKRPTKPLPEPRQAPTSRKRVSGLRDGVPDAVAKAYEEAQRIHREHYPYVWGGGHNPQFAPTATAVPLAPGFDCSGSVSRVLHVAGLLGGTSLGGATRAPAGGGAGPPTPVSGPATPREQPLVSGQFEHWGKPGKGQWITVYANYEHVFMVFHGLKKAGEDEHFGTGDWGKGWGGAGLNPRLHPTAGFVARHPRGA